MRITCVLMMIGLVVVAGSPTGASELSPATQEKIEELMELTGSSDMAEQMGSAIVEQMMAAIKQASPDTPTRAVDIVAEVVSDSIKTESEALIEMSLPLYGKYFSEEELDAMIAFYRTPVGQKMIETMPALMQESMQIGTAWAMELMPSINEKVQERMKSEGLIE